MELVQEQVGDLVLLGQVLRESKLSEYLDAQYPVHGNWSGPSVGQLTVGWLMYIISECDHRLSNVEEWAARHLRSLRWALAYPALQATHFQDDRLGRLLEYFSEEAPWRAAQGAFNRHLIEVYRLDQGVVRLDSVNATSFRTANELFQAGVRKKHQASLPQLKTMVASLDPLGLPLTCYTVAGNRADDNLYVPALRQAQDSLPGQGLLYVGDSKLGHQSNLNFIAHSDNYYLCPLSQTQYSLRQLAAAVEQAQQQGPEEVWDEEHKKLLAQVFELEAQQRQGSDEQGPAFRWSERRVLIQSPDQAQRLGQKLVDNLHQAKVTIAERFVPRQGRKIFRQGEEGLATAFIEQVLKKHQVQHLIHVELQAGLSAAQDKQPPLLKVIIQQQQAAVEEAQRILGWRVFATNAPVDLLPPQQVLYCYRKEYLIEQQFHRLLTKTTDLLPIYLQKPNRIQALLRLLLLALQITALIQHQVRERLQQNQQHLQGIVAGNPSRKVQRPTCEAMLLTFCAVAVSWVILPSGLLPLVSNLSPLNRQILTLLGLDAELYQTFALSFKDVKELGEILSET